MNAKRTEYAIEANGVHKKYAGGKDGAGLNGFDLEVRSGTVCGLLGPNGAGKTTAVKILSTLLKLDKGQASVAGFDVTTQSRQVRESIGLVGQYAAVDEILSAQQNLMMFGQLYHLSSREAKRRADELLEQFALMDTGNMPVSKFSGGMRRRLDLAVSLIVSPPVLFVDEPTTGLDPAGRREVWTAVRALVANGATVLLTTQYLEEADQLAHRISMLKDGRVIAEGTPDELKSALFQYPQTDRNKEGPPVSLSANSVYQPEAKRSSGFASGGAWLDIVLRSDIDREPVEQIVQRVASGAIHIDAEANRISVPVMDRTRALVTVATALSEAQIEPEDIVLRRPTLDEVFLHLTGHAETERTVEVAS